MTTTLMQKVAHVAPDTYNFILATAGEVKESPFRDEIVGELDTLVKRANALPMPPSAFKTFGSAMAGIGAMAGTGIAMALAGDMYDAVKRGITKSRNYKSMMQENPDLGEFAAKDVQKAFATLHRFTPEFAGDPTVAGSFVRRQAQLGEFDPKQLTDFLGARKNLSDTKKLPMVGKLPWQSGQEREKSDLELAQLRHSVEIKDPAQADLFGAQAENARRPPHPDQIAAWQGTARSGNMNASSKLNENINNRSSRDDMRNKARGHRRFSP